FIARACPSTKAMPSAAHRSASQYHVNMHSAATTRSSRYGATISRNAAGVVFTLRCTQHLAGRVEDADVHGLHVEIDSAIVTVLPVVESHRFSSCAVAHLPCASLLIISRSRGGLNENHALAADGGRCDPEPPRLKRSVGRTSEQAD